MENQPSLLGYVLLIINLIFIWDFIRDKNIKIHEQSQNKLNFTIQPKLPWFFGFIIGQIGIISLSVVFLIIPVTQLDCDRVLQNLPASGIENSSSTIICQLIEFDLFGHPKIPKQISGLIGTRLQKQTETDTDGKFVYKYRVQLLTNAESVPFTKLAYPNYSRLNYERLESIISSINDFLARPLKKSLVVKQDDTLIVYASIGITLFCLLLGLLIIATGSFINCNFDKELNSFTLSRYRWFGKFGKTVFLYSLNEIVDIKVKSIHSDEGEYVYGVSLKLISDETVTLSGYYSSRFQEKQQIVKTIKSFLAAN
jgi:uncharacterized Tic20 family protein